MDFLERRIKDEAIYICKTGCTVRCAAKVFGVSKSTVHKDMTERLECVDRQLFLRVRAVLDKNFSERHIRGGIATKMLYKNRDKTK